MKKKYLTRNFVLLCQGSLFTSIGSVFYSVAIGIWVFDKTGSTALMGYVSSINYIMSLIFASLAGVLVDRMNNKTVLVVSDAIRGVCMLIIGMFARFDLLDVSHVIGVAIISAACQLFFTPASTVIFTKIVTQDDYLQANSLFRGLDSFVRTIGNGVSGFLIIQFGFSAMILFNGISLIISAITEMFIALPKLEKNNEQKANNYLDDLKEGFRYAYQDKILLRIGVVFFLTNFLCAGFHGVVYPWGIAKGFTVEQYGIYLGIGSLSSILAMIFLSAKEISKEKFYKTSLYSICIFVVFNILAMVFTNYYLICICTMIVGISNMIFNMILNSVLLYRIEEEHRGKILGMVTSVTQGAIGLSMIFYGSLSEFLGVANVALIGAVLVIIPVVILFKQDAFKMFLASN